MEEITYALTRRLGKTAKVNPEIVRAIRKEHAQGVRQVVLAKKYGLAQPNISKIVRRLAWTFVEDEPLDN